MIMLLFLYYHLVHLGILKDVEGELGSLPQHIDVAALNETRNLVDQYLKD